MWTYAATAIVVAVLAFSSAWKVQDWRHDAQEKQRLEAEQETQRLRARTADKASEGHEQFKETERVVYQTITETVDKIVDRPVYRNVCFDTGGLRQLNAAITGHQPAASEPATAVPGPAADQ